MTLPNIGLIGRLRSGKDTVGSYLTERYGYLPVAFGLLLKEKYHQEYPEIPRKPKPRAGYQEYGQRIRRERGDDYWVNSLFKLLDTTLFTAGVIEGVSGRPYKPGPPVVITDVRQLNEAEALAARSYVLIRVSAPDSLRIQRAVESGDTFSYADLAHGTETALDGYAADFTVTNDAGLAELYAQIDEIMSYLTLKSGGEAA